jgi:hypothetical protein
LNQGRLKSEVTARKETSSILVTENLVKTSNSLEIIMSAVPPFNGHEVVHIGEQTLSNLQVLAEHLAALIPRSNETALQVNALAVQNSSNGDAIAVLRDRTDMLNTAVQSLDNRTGAIADNVGHLANITTSSRDQIQDVAQSIGYLRADTAASIETLVQRIRAEIIPALTPAPIMTSNDGNTPSSSTGNPVPNGEATVPPSHASEAEYAFRLRVQVGDLRKYNGDRPNDAALFWTKEAALWLRRYKELTRANISETQGIHLLADGLEGKAKNWWLQRQAAADEGFEILPISVEGFLADVRQEYQELQAEESRRDRYEKLTQTGTVQAFVSKIRDVVIHLNPRPSEYEMLRHFRKGLREDILFEMETHYSHITEYNAYIRQANSIDLAFQRIKDIKRKSDRNKTGSQQSNSRSTAGRSDAPDKPARVYTIGSPIPSKKRDPEGFKTWCRSNNACFECGGKDHKATNCDKKNGTSNGASESEN